jgi:hypothetical protein
VLWEIETLLPPTKREARDRAREQQKRSADRRREEQASIFVSQQKEDAASEGEDGNLAKKVSSLENAINTLIDQEGTTESRRTDRLLERIEQSQAQLRAPAPQPLRGGAGPLIGTGLETFIAFGAVAAAALWTLRRAKKAEG